MNVSLESSRLYKILRNKCIKENWVADHGKRNESHNVELNTPAFQFDYDVLSNRSVERIWASLKRLHPRITQVQTFAWQVSRLSFAPFGLPVRAVVDTAYPRFITYSG